MQIFFNLLVIFADIKIIIAVVHLIMEMCTSEGLCFKMSDGCMILGHRPYQDDDIFPLDEPELIYLNLIW